MTRDEKKEYVKKVFDACCVTGKIHVTFRSEKPCDLRALVEEVLKDGGHDFEFFRHGEIVPPGCAPKYPRFVVVQLEKTSPLDLNVLFNFVLGDGRSVVVVSDGVAYGWPSGTSPLLNRTAVLVVPE